MKAEEGRERGETAWVGGGNVDDAGSPIKALWSKRKEEERKSSPQPP